ncbi:hypothetical protein IQ269_09725 [Tychonema sp. LEGE 07199]|nr:MULTISPECIES: hypothetical protein [unclassified Tychonema]MBE9121089.1 hypothetical protein [Tychonema sp. LEGE 07199]MBE9134511.1 hypothetical protein [Tychonema sp. LEGE 07196]
MLTVNSQQSTVNSEFTIPMKRGFDIKYSIHISKLKTIFGAKLPLLGDLI